MSLRPRAAPAAPAKGGSRLKVDEPEQSDPVAPPCSSPVLVGAPCAAAVSAWDRDSHTSSPYSHASSTSPGAHPATRRV